MWTNELTESRPGSGHRRRVAALAAGAAVLLTVGAGAAVALPTRDAARSGVRDGVRPRTVILLIGDGMGVQEITAARYYLGVRSRLEVDRMPMTGFDTTWSVKPRGAAPFLPDYDPDSASTGTQWATGRKTLDERISQAPSRALDVPGAALTTVLELAQRRGMRVGDVSTAELTDATPAVLAAHQSQRGCQGPADMSGCPRETKAAGGLGSIAEQEVDHRVDVLLGGGRSRFEQRITGGPDAGRTVVESARRQGYHYVTDAAGLRRLSSQRPVLGLFSPGTMTPEWTGPAATLGKGNPPVACTQGQRSGREPALAELTERALDLLENPRGFFLQVEGASIDKQDHAANACGQLGETVAFDRAVGVALDYRERHPDTLVVVTADHSHTSQIVAEDASGSGLPTGYSTNLRTADGQTLTLSYGTAGFGGNGAAPAASPGSQQHTGAVVPVWAAGPGATAVLGTNDHTDLFHLLGG